MIGTKNKQSKPSLEASDDHGNTAKQKTTAREIGGGGHIEGGTSDMCAKCRDMKVGRAELQNAAAGSRLGNIHVRIWTSGWSLRLGDMVVTSRFVQTKYVRVHSVPRDGIWWHQEAAIQEPARAKYSRCRNMRGKWAVLPHIDGIEHSNHFGCPLFGAKGEWRTTCNWTINSFQPPACVA
ncbi:hypothetical protein B0H10DRAFT_1940312 [Mycena sp. CBHHK59/15]|nr:hypothetical protein B0H10DRAFT_1940312 [Mycena sp. CBHHK59/15]